MKNKIFLLSMALLWTLSFGTALHSWPLGLSMGLCMAIVFGLFDQDEEIGESAKGRQKGDKS